MKGGLIQHRHICWQRSLFNISFFQNAMQTTHSIFIRLVCTVHYASTLCLCQRLHHHPAVLVCQCVPVHYASTSCLCQRLHHHPEVFRRHLVHLITLHVAIQDEIGLGTDAIGLRIYAIGLGTHVIGLGTDAAIQTCRN